VSLTKRKPHRSTNAVSFTVWTVNGGPVSQEAVEKLEAAIEKILFERFNDGERLLTQTNKE